MTANAGDRNASGQSRSRIASALVTLYPRSWRERYGDELLDLLESRPLSIATVVATLRGAVDAHANLPRLVPSCTLGSARLRWSVTSTFAAWVAFCVATAGVAKTTEAAAFTEAAHNHVALAVSRMVASVAFALTALAIGYGALVLAAPAIQQAYRRRDLTAFRLMATPLVAAAAVVGSGALLGRLRLGPVHSIGTIALAAGWGALVLTTALAAVHSASTLVHRTDVAPRLLRHAGWAAIVGAGAMSTGELAGVAYGLAVAVGTPHLFGSPNGVLATPLPLTWALALLVATAATVVASRASLTALRTLRPRG